MKMTRETIIIMEILMMEFKIQIKKTKGTLRQAGGDGVGEGEGGDDTDKVTGARPRDIYFAVGGNVDQNGDISCD